MDKTLMKDAKVYFVKGVGKKSGKAYVALRIEFENNSNLDRMVFLNKFEVMAYEPHANSK